MKISYLINYILEMSQFNIEMDQINNENFTANDIHQIYASNENFDIMYIAKITKITPDKIYKKLKPFFEEPKTLRGYRECKDYIKKQNNLSREICNTQSEISRVRNEITSLKDIKKELEDNKKKQLEEYYSFKYSFNSEEGDEE
jgi:hypothetical protein